MWGHVLGGGAIEGTVVVDEPLDRLAPKIAVRVGRHAGDVVVEDGFVVVEGGRVGNQRGGVG